MIEMIESKIAQLNEQIKESNAYLSQVELHKANVAKLTGAIEAFRAVLAAMNTPKPEPINKPESESVENSGI